MHKTTNQYLCIMSAQNKVLGITVLSFSIIASSLRASLLFRLPISVGHFAELHTFSCSMVGAIKLICSNSHFAVLISEFARVACACAQASLSVNCVGRVSGITIRCSSLRSLRSLHGTPRKRGAP